MGWKRIYGDRLSCFCKGVIQGISKILQCIGSIISFVSYNDVMEYVSMQKLFGELREYLLMGGFSGVLQIGMSL